jgi:hypothetical protein
MNERKFEMVIRLFSRQKPYAKVKYLKRELFLNRNQLKLYDELIIDLESSFDDIVI